MFGISYETWRDVCDMYFSLSEDVDKVYLQWYPFAKLGDGDKDVLASREFYDGYIRSGGFVLLPEVMRRSDNFIHKGDGTFRDSALVSPLVYLVLQAIGKEVASRYEPSRPGDVSVYYAGNYERRRPRYRQEYDEFYKVINEGKDRYRYFIKTDISNFFGSIDVNELFERVGEGCYHDGQAIAQARLLLAKELLLYCGDGRFPLIENSMACSYLATVVYLDVVDCEIRDFVESKVPDISSFQMVRYVDDLYILFTTAEHAGSLASIYNMVRNEYSSILRSHGLALNSKKCVMRRTSEIHEELKRSLYDECVNGIEFDMGGLFAGRMGSFLRALLGEVTGMGLTPGRYRELIDDSFAMPDVEFTPEEVFNYLVYEDATEIGRPEVSDLIEQAVEADVTFLAVDPKRLAVMVLRTKSEAAVKAMLRQLFARGRAGLWNSYDTTVAVAYLVQRGFRHRDLLRAVEKHDPDLHAYYEHGCSGSFVAQLRDPRRLRWVRCVEGDQKAAFLYFMSLCERARSNHLGEYAYYKNFFDRISADMAFKARVDRKCKKPNYKKYYRVGELKKLYADVDGSHRVIDMANKLRNQSPLSHASAELVGKEGSSKELDDAREGLERLIDEFVALKGL